MRGGIGLIKIGLTTWSEHDYLLKKPKPTLAEYASKLPVVELDTSFYAIPTQQSVLKWVLETPPNFRFIVKAHQTMTLHKPWQDYFSSQQEAFTTLINSLQPMIKAQRLASILFQFPPNFVCETQFVRYLRMIRQWMGDLPVAIEFRHDSWFLKQYLPETIALMKQYQFTLVIVDQPKVPHSAPFYPVTTNSAFQLVRLHGRNHDGWLKKGEDWRSYRTLYDYSDRELSELAQVVEEISSFSQDTYVIFNNNAGGDAAKNALSLQNKLQIKYQGLNPEQIQLF